jgi:hypothetical protein
MKNHLKTMVWLTVVVCITVIIAGCNIFGFSSDEKLTTTEKAEEYISEGKYTLAQKELAAAVRDSLDAMALYLNAKATVLAAGCDVAQIAELIEGQTNLQNGSQLAILETIDELSDAEVTAWYKANTVASANLARIWNGTTFGVLKKEDIALDFSVSNMLTGVIGIRDTNRDGEVNENDFDLNIGFLDNAGAQNKDGFNIDGATIVNNLGQTVTLEGLTVFLGQWQGKVASLGKTAENGYTPDDINHLLAFILGILDSGEQSILYLVLGFQDQTTFDVSEIQQHFNEIASVINFYWYNDGEDNDRDGWVDEELIDGEDNDDDGLVDEDSDYTTYQMVSAPGYNPYYDVSAKENNVTGESRDFIAIFNEWLQ